MTTISTSRLEMQNKEYTILAFLSHVATNKTVQEMVASVVDGEVTCALGSELLKYPLDIKLT